jgi:hypothetical protein
LCGWTLRNYPINEDLSLGTTNGRKHQCIVWM